MTDQPTTLEKDAEKVLTDLEKLQQLNQEYLDGWKRAKADYINFKRDAEKEKMEIVQFANAGLLLELLPILDNLKTAMKHVPENMTKESWVKALTTSCGNSATCSKPWAWKKFKPSAKPSTRKCTKPWPRKSRKEQRRTPS